MRTINDVDTQLWRSERARKIRRCRPRISEDENDNDKLDGMYPHDIESFIDGIEDDVILADLKEFT